MSPATVTRWRECFERDGLKASVKVRPGRGRKPSIAPEKVAEIVHATLHEKPPGETHWSCRSMARAHGVSHTHGPEDLGRSRAQAAPGRDVQAVQGPAV